MDTKKCINNPKDSKKEKREQKTKKYKINNKMGDKPKHVNTTLNGNTLNTLTKRQLIRMDF